MWSAKRATFTRWMPISGAVLGSWKIGIEERNSCPFFTDGKLYVHASPGDPRHRRPRGPSESGTKGALYIIKPTDKEGEIIAHVALDGRCFGTPTAYNGKLYIQTTRHLYCFGKPGNNPGLPAATAAEPWPAPGPATQLQIIPAEVLMRPGQTGAFRVRSLDANGFTVAELQDLSAVKWASFVPPTAKVRSAMKAAFNAEGRLVAAAESTPSAGAFRQRSPGNSRAICAAAFCPICPSSRILNGLP